MRWEREFHACLFVYGVCKVARVGLRLVQKGHYIGRNRQRCSEWQSPTAACGAAAAAAH
jgi:hypothetical protein